jgi:hypothetical protein
MTMDFSLFSEQRNQLLECFVLIRQRIKDLLKEAAEHGQWEKYINKVIDKLSNIVQNMDDIDDILQMEK